MLDYRFGDELPVHDHGYVKLLEVMGSDEVIVDAARISYDRRGKSEDRALLRYLIRHRHTSPFEMGVLRFEVKMPIFVARQWIRHRTASLNELSARYTELPDEMFVPESFSYQSPDNKQGRSEKLEELVQAGLHRELKRVHEVAYGAYQGFLDSGVARELARGVLPVNTYTKFVWKMDLHNLMHFLDLRLDSYAQKEIRDFAEVIEKLVALYFPVSYEAFVDYVRDAYTCSRMEVELIRRYMGAIQTREENDNWFALTEGWTGMTKRELADFKRRFLDG